MVILRNIKRTENTMEADFYPEGRGAKGFVKISLPVGEYLEVIPSPEYPHSSDPAHARYELLRLAELETLPEEKTVLWY